MGKWLITAALEKGQVFVSRDMKEYTIQDVDERGVIVTNPEGVAIPKGLSAWVSFKEKMGLVEKGKEGLRPAAVEAPASVEGPAEELTEKDILPVEGLETKGWLIKDANLSSGKTNFPNIDMYKQEIKSMYLRNGYDIKDCEISLQNAPLREHIGDKHDPRECVRHEKEEE